MLNSYILTRLIQSCLSFKVAMNPHSVDDQITISDDPEKVDINLVYNFLTHSYWAKGRTKQAVETSIKNSLCFGVCKD